MLLPSALAPKGRPVGNLGCKPQAGSKPQAGVYTPDILACFEGRHPMQLRIRQHVLPDLSLEQVLGTSPPNSATTASKSCLGPPERADRRYAGVTHLDVTDFTPTAAEAGTQTRRRHRSGHQWSGLLPEPPDARRGQGSAGQVEHIRRVDPRVSVTGHQSHEHLRRPRLDEIGGRQLAGLSHDTTARSSPTPRSKGCGLASRIVRCCLARTSGPAARTSRRRR